MSDAPDRPNRPEEEGEGELDDVLRAAFAPSRRDPSPIEQPSVLTRLAGLAGSSLRVTLTEADEGPAPVIEALARDRGPSLGTARYQVLGELARGGVGIVYHGRDVDLGRDVAMKVLHEKFLEQPDILQRFVEEAQIGGQLQHPGIVPVYEMGLRADERPYFTMKLVKGETLAALLEKRGPGDRDRHHLLAIFEKICQTLAYAHARHVVHRDLKPANVMLGAFGEVQVVDWGFAKVLKVGGIADERRLRAAHERESVIETARSSGTGSDSLAGSVMGTPAYMPPEQAQGDVDRMDPRSDVFALGAILCEILTGAPPYSGAPSEELLLLAARCDTKVAFERLDSCGADPKLVELTRHCLSAARAARPRDAGALAETIHDYLTSVEERARSARYRARLIGLSAVAGLVILALGAGGWIWTAGQAQTRRAAVLERVATANSEASGALGRAQAAGLDPTRWVAAVDAADRVVTEAQSEDVPAESRAAAEAQLAEVKDELRAAEAETARLEREAAMLERLEVLRIPTDEDVRVQYWEEREHRRLDAAYGEAFTAYLGRPSFLTEPIASVVESLSQSDSKTELAASLDHWGLVRDALQEEDDAPDATGTARIRMLAEMLDSDDAWRRRLRGLLPTAADQGPLLRELAEEADFSALTAAGCRVLSQALWRGGEKEAAVAVLRRGRLQHPRDFDLCFRLALQLELLDEPPWEEVVATQHIAHALKPERSETLHRMGLALDQLGRLAEAEEPYRLLVSRHPASFDPVMHLADTLRLLGAVDEAAELFRRAVELDPGNTEIRNSLSVVLSSQGKRDEAIEVARRALEIEPRNARLHFNLAVLLSEAGEWHEAIESFERALECEPRDAKTHTGLGHALANDGRLDEAIESLERALELDPRLVPAYMELGDVLAKQGKLDEAIDRYRRALEIDPHHSVARTRLGGVLSAQGKWDEASESFERALRDDPRDTDALIGLGSVLRQQGKWDAAIESHERALEINPRLAPAHSGIALVLSTQGRLDEAIERFRRALEIDPRGAPTHVNLGGALRAAGRLEEALAALETAEALFAREDTPFARVWGTRARQQRTQILNELGMARGAQGELDEALVFYRRGLELDPRAAPLHYNLGNVLRQLGRFDEALAALQKARPLFAEWDSEVGRKWQALAGQQIEELRTRLDQLPDLEAVLAGERRPASNEEWAAAIGLAFETRRFSEIVTLTEEALRTSPALVARGLPVAADIGPAAYATGTYLSACAAALLAAGTTPELNRNERVRVRGLALAWLAREIEVWQAALAGGGPNAADARGSLEYTRQDGSFVTVRGAAIAALPDGERAGWTALWEGIDRALDG